MINDEVRIYPIGDTALTVEFGNAISLDLNQKAIAFADYFLDHPFPGFIEAIPAYASATIIYDPVVVRRAMQGNAFSSVTSIAKDAVESLAIDSERPTRLIEIPMLSNDECAPDLPYVAELHDLSEKDVLRIFTEREYRVYMLGFLPGFSYMGDIDDRIATPRRETPRTEVPSGSIGIAGRQTGIYSISSPGGWNLIGRAACETFTPKADAPSLLRPGDRVRFVLAE